MAEELQVLYEGWVQGVGFRYTARELMKQFQVTGFVRNLKDGRVELVLQGEKTEVERATSAVRLRWGSNIQNTNQLWRDA